MAPSITDVRKEPLYMQPKVVRSQYMTVVMVTVITVARMAPDGEIISTFLTVMGILHGMRTCPPVDLLLAPEPLYKRDN